MTFSRARKNAAKALGMALQVRYRKLLQAVGEDEIAIAAVDLGKCFNDNIEFTIWALRTYGGDELPVPTPGVAPIQDGLPKMPPLLAAGRDVL